MLMGANVNDVVLVHLDTKKVKGFIYQHEYAIDK
jgi:hypothetical protein